MPRPPLVLLLLAAAGLFFARPAFSQQGAPAVDPASVLATLKDIRTKQPAVVNRERANVLAAINAAIADPGKTYEQAQAALESQGGTGNQPGGNQPGRGNPAFRAAESRKRQNDLLLNRDFINGLRLQLIYLALSWQHQSGIKTANLLNPLLDYTAQVTAAANAFAAFEPLRKNIADTLFATYFQVAPYLSGMADWDSQPFDVNGIYEQTILPEMRLEKDPRLLTYWDNRIQTESARAEGSQNGLVMNKFRNIQLPKLLWARAEDEIALGRQNQGIADMLALIKAHPDHPDFEKWAAELEKLVSPQVAAPSPSASP